MNEGGAAESGTRVQSRGGGSRLRTAAEAVREYDIVFYSFALSRLALLAVGLLTESNIRPITTRIANPQLSPYRALNIWGAWDTGWYIDLAVHGYQRAASADGQANWAFFPAYPALAGAVAGLTGVSAFEAMLVISNVCFLGGLIVVHRLACAEFDKKTADLSVLLLCVAPGSYIFSAAYTESLFLLCLSAGFLLIRNRKWLAAGIVAAAAVATRNLGIGLLLPYAWAAADRLFRDARGRDKPALAAAEMVRVGLGGVPPILAVLAFMLYLQARTGDPLAFVHVQKAWGRSFGNPFADLLAGLVYPGKLADSNVVSFVAAWCAIALIVKLVLLRKPALLALALFLTLVPLTAGIASFARYALVIVPLWLVLANVLASRPRTAIAIVALFAMLDGFLMAAWTLGLKVTM